MLLANDSFSTTVNSTECDTNESFENKTMKYKIGVPILVGLCILSVIANGYILTIIRHLTRSLSPTLYFTLR